MVEITEKTKKEIEVLVAKKGLKLVWDENPSSTFQEHVNRDKKEITVKTNIDPSDFDRLFQQHDTNYEVERDQEMFIFNTLHGIGHFELNLWSNIKSPSDTQERLKNFFQDKKIDAWAYNELLKIRNEQKT